MIVFRISVLSLLLYLVSPNAWCQDASYSFRELLSKIEEYHNVQFIYGDETIRDITVSQVDISQNLDQVLKEISATTNLIFRPLSDTDIAILSAAELKVNICGYLVDRDSGKPLVAATIQAGNRFTITGEAGYFIMEDLNPEGQVQLRYLGYDTRVINVSDLSDSDCLTLEMTLNVTTLREVVVNNYISKGIDKKIDGTYSIENTLLGILPGLTDPDVLQTIQALPGIQSINETISDINVRGGTNDQNLMLWDGIRMYQPGHFFGLISAFNPYLIRDVSLIKNGTSASFSEGVSSTIDIRTHDRVSQEVEGGAGVNMINADVYLNLPIGKKASLQLASRRSISDILQTPTYDQYFTRIFRGTDVTGNVFTRADSILSTSENFLFYDVTGKLLYDITSKDKIRLSFLNIANRIDYQESEFVGNQAVSRTSNLDQKSLAGGITYTRRWNPRLRTRAQLYVSDYLLSALNNDISADQRLIQENKVLDTGLKLDATVILSPVLDLETGYQFFEIGVTNLEDINNPEFRRRIKEVIRSHGLFAELNYYSPSGNTNLRTGLRATYIAKFDRFLPEPRLAFNQRFLSNFSFELLGELKHQYTSQIIDLPNDFLGIEKRRWILANDADIPLMQSRQLSTGITYQRSNTLVSVEGYYKNVTGITSSGQGFQNQYQYIRSSGDYEIYGVDLLFNRDFGNIGSWISYSWADNQFDFPEFTPPVFPNNLDVTHLVTVGAAYNAERFQLSAGMNWHTGKPFTPVDEAQPVEDGVILYDTANSDRLPEYLRLDLSAKYNFRMGRELKGQVGFSLWNVLNRQNIVNRFYVLQQGEPEQVQQYALGITPNFMFRVDF